MSGYMCPDPYSGAPGVEEVEKGLYRVTVRLAGSRGDKRITFTLRLGETLEQSWLVFNPLLSRFMGGEDYPHRPVRISDSGRIRNELQTLCSEALEFPQQDHIRVHFDRIPPEVIPPRLPGQAAGDPALVQETPPDLVRLARHRRQVKPNGR